MRLRLHWSAFLALGLALLARPAAQAQRRPYIGYVYPAGGQICTTFEVRCGGQDLDEVTQVLITGKGVSARVVENFRRLNNQEVQLLREQLGELKRGRSGAKGAKPPAMSMEPAMAAMAGEPAAAGATPPVSPDRLIASIERRLREWVQTPACASIAGLVMVEVTVAPDAEPGPREIRLATLRGVSNPLAFQIGQFQEYARKPMTTATIQVLGKEAGALRQRPAGEVEDRVALPCTVNGQIASGEMNRYRFAATKGQRLVLSTQARQLVPFIADAVPGWFQPVLVVYDAQGREVAFADDFRFKPDPVILFEVPQDGEYVFAIYDSLYRGREDFVYRITIGDMPFVTSIFPLGSQAGAVQPPSLVGFNVTDADVAAPPADAAPGVRFLTASRLGFRSNPVPFVVETLPDVVETEPNNSTVVAQPITLPLVVNGRIGRPGDWDVYQFTGKAGDKVVLEVEARRLDSPLDSVIKLTDAAGKLLAFNDDREELTAGLNTHHADSYLLATLPAAGAYCVHIGDTAGKGGDDYGYRLRVGAPQPDFELRVVPSSVALTTNTTATVTVYAERKDGFTGPIKLALEKAVEGLTAAPVVLGANQTLARLTLKSGAKAMREPVRLSVLGTAKIGANEVAHPAVPAEDRMQAFLWRHLVPASDLPVLVYDRNYQPPAKRVPRAKPSMAATIAAVTQPAATTVSSNAGGTGSTTTTTGAKPKFTKQQIVGRLRQLKLLYEENLLTDDFYEAKVAECDASQ
jgi:hypothetical protein